MQLQDDPFRSLAGELRRAGGFAKDTTPYSEGFFPPKDQKKDCRSGFRRHHGASAAARAKRRGGISAGLVRTQG
jgi:hypothetical protein